MSTPGPQLCLSIVMAVIEIEVLASEQCSFIHSMNNSVEHISPKSRCMDYLVQTTLYDGLFQQS